MSILSMRQANSLKEPRQQGQRIMALVIGVKWTLGISGQYLDIGKMLFPFMPSSRILEQADFKGQELLNGHRPQIEPRNKFGSLLSRHVEVGHEIMKGQINTDSIFPIRPY